MIGIRGNKTSKTELIEGNGKYVLDNICTKATVTEELNGDYSFDGIFIIDKTLPNELYDLMENDSLIYVDEEYGREYFRIAQVRKNKRDIEIFARHITISDILTMWLEDVRPTESTGNSAINWIFDNAKGANWFNVSSNIENKGTAYYINKNVYEALFTTENSFLDRWGGEVYRRGFNIAINGRVGADRGVEIRSRKNLKGLEVSTNINSLCTRIYPIGFDGITINEKHIDSKLIDNYSKVYSKQIKYENVKVKSETVEEGYDTLEQAQAELKRLAELEFNEKKIDIITASYRVDFVELGKTEEYKNYSILEQTWLGDTIKVIDEEMGINISVRVTKRIYDCKKKERTSTELSNKDTKEKPPTIQDIINKVEDIPIVDGNQILQAAKDNATALIQAGLKDSYVIVRPNEILIMDTKDVNTAIKVWRWNQGGLGYSSTGYYGEFGIAITNNGSVVADFITTGILNANLIKTGVLRSFNSLSWINMQDGTFNFADKIKFDGSSFDIDLSNEGLATEEELNAARVQINANSEGITRKVSKGQEFSTEFNQNSQEFNFNIGNEGTNVKIDKNGQTIKNGALTILDSFNKKIFGTDLEGGVTFSGRLQPNDNSIRLFGENCRIDGSSGALRFQKDPSNYVSVDNTATRFFNGNSDNGTKYTSLATDKEGHAIMWGASTMMKLLGKGEPGIQARWVNDDGYCPIQASSFTISSKREFKENIHLPTEVDFLEILMQNKIKAYNYKKEIELVDKTPTVLLKDGTNPVKADIKLGLVIEELDEVTSKLLHPKNSEGVDLYSMCSVLWEVCREQQTILEILKEKAGI